MAQMIPDKIPYRASMGEKRLFSILQQLPDDCIVYYEPVVRNRYPDFVLICPDMGLMVVEVKGWYRSNLVSADCQTVVVRERGQEKSERHPLRQAREYMYSLMDICRNAPRFGELLNPDGQYKNRFVFPFGHFAVLSNITSEQLKQAGLENAQKVFPPDKVVTRETMMSWEEFGPEQVKEIIGTFFDPTWPFPKLDQRQVDLLRSIVHPEIVIAGNTAAVPDKALETDLKVLDLKQEKNARSLGCGHRLVFGVAGSGKTVLLISRARYLSGEQPESRILVICYNVSFASYLKGALSDCPNANVWHFDGWSKENGVVRMTQESDENLGKRLFETLVEGRGDCRSYDSVLIDEAQDFEPDWFECVLEAMKDPNDGDLLIVGDGAQGLYRKGKISWKSIGISAVGRSVSRKFDLDKNYRNSREILELAACFAPLSSEEDEDGVLSVRVEPEKCLRETGALPVLYLARNRRQECDFIRQKIREIIEESIGGETSSEPVKPSQIGILYRNLAERDKSVFLEFKQSLESRYPVVWLNESRASKERTGEDGIKIQTIHGSKGLQYRVVIVMWADLLPAAFENTDEAAERRLLYVALTRPEEHLIVTCSKISPFVSEIVRSKKAEVVKAD